MSIKVKKIYGWAAFLSALEHMQYRWIFRGNTSHKDSQIRSSLQRFFEREEIKPKQNRDEIETELIREFKRAYHQYATHIPDDEAKIHWLSLMQHYGAPTRLVDFTYSPYIAAFFTLEDTRDKHYSVYAFDSTWLFKTSLAKIKDEKGARTDWLEILEKPATADPMVIDAQNEAFFTEPFVKSACTQNPFRLNERLHIQKGVFVVQGDLRTTFMRNIEALPGHNLRQYAVRFDLVLDRKQRREWLSRLHHMGITRTSLFPGLDGYSQSLGTYVPRLMDIAERKRKDT